MRREINPIALITLDRPSKLNALNREMVAELAAICREVEHSLARVALITGAGEKSFCAGGDISAWSSETPEDFGRFWVRRRPCRIRCGGPIAPADDRSAQRRLPWRRTGAGLLCGLSHRRAPCADWHAGDRSRHSARLVRHAAGGAPVRPASSGGAWRFSARFSAPRTLFNSGSSTSSAKKARAWPLRRRCRPSFWPAARRQPQPPRCSSTPPKAKSANVFWKRYRRRTCRWLA